MEKNNAKENIMDQLDQVSGGVLPENIIEDDPGRPEMEGGWTIYDLEKKNSDQGLPGGIKNPFDPEPKKPEEIIPGLGEDRTSI